MPDNTSEEAPGIKVYLAFVGDGLSLLRVLGALLVILFSLMGAWVLAFIILVLAWLTDLGDGWAARRWRSLGAYWRQEAKEGRLDPKSFKATFDADGIADAFLGFTSSVVPVIYLLATTQSKWVMMPVTLLALVYIASALMGWVMVRAMQRDSDFKEPNTQALVLINMTVFHGVFQIGFTITWFAIMAFGWWMVLPMAIVLGIITWRQLPKINLWLKGRLVPAQ